IFSCPLELLKLLVNPNAFPQRDNAFRTGRREAKHFVKAIVEHPGKELGRPLPGQHSLRESAVSRARDVEGEIGPLQQEMPLFHKLFLAVIADKILSLPEDEFDARLRGQAVRQEAASGR